MPAPGFKAEARGNYVAGKFAAPGDPNGEIRSVSPGDFSDSLGVHRYAYADVDRAVDAARSAWPTWRRTPVADRVASLKRYQEAIRRRQDDLAEVIAREVGKPLWEAKTEITAMTSKIDITANDSLKLVQDFEIKAIQPGTSGVCRYRPLGVMAVLGPFNFPGHLPNGHIVPALMTGNTVVFKPSEKAPLVGQIMAECMHEAGLPAGVFNLIQGEKEVGRRLCVHEGVDGILFTGSYEVGVRIKQDTLQQHWKLLALEMGGKNASIVWQDARLEQAAKDVLFSAFATTGQRCSATSRVIVHSSVADEFTRILHERSKAFTIGHPLAPVFMGPIIDARSVDRYMKFLGIASREGFEVVMRGKSLQVEGYEGNYVTPSICRLGEITLETAKKSVYLQTEIFAPNVAIVPTDDIDEAIALANCTQYGLVTSVFTQSRPIYDRCVDDLECGLVNWNKPTVGASSKLPFGGLKKSGNHFPTALTATGYCTYPLASLETEDPQAGGDDYPGLNWGKKPG